MKKKLLRLCSIVLVISMVLGNVVSLAADDTESVDTGSTGANQKLLLNEKLMETRITNSAGTLVRAFGSHAYNCAVDYKQIILSEGNTCVISYSAHSDGLLRITDMTVGFHNNASADREFEFAVTDNNGKVLSNNGSVLTLNESKASVSGLSIETRELKKGECIYFVFHSNLGYNTTVNTIDCKPTMEFSVDEGNTWTQVSTTDSGCYVPWPYDITAYPFEIGYPKVEQGMGGFYYYSSDTYMLTEHREESTSKLVINPWQMNGSTTNSNSGVTYITYDAYDCMTSTGEIIVSAGYTNVISYEAPSDGVIWIENMHTFIRTPKTATASYSVDFAVIDDEGNILINDGELYNMSATETWTDAQSVAKALTVSKREIKQGERIYFVFHGIEGTTTSVRCNAAIQFCKNGSTEAECVNAYNSSNTNVVALRSSTTDATLAQGTGNFYYEYSNVYELVEKSEPEYVYFNPNEMNAETTTNANFPFMRKNYDCMTNFGQIIVSAGYNNIIAYEAEKAGTLCIDEMKVWISGDVTTHQSEFAVVDENGKIISNHGKKYIVNGSTSATEASEAAKNIPVSKHKMNEGERIYFVFHGVNGSTQSLRCNAKILFCAEGENTWTHVNGSDVYSSAEMTLYSKNNTVTPTQGLAGFYYLYSKEDTTDVGKLGKEIGTETEGVVTVYETPAKDATYLDKYITEVASDGTVSYIDLDMLNIKKQSKLNEEDSSKIDIRYIASVDELSCYKSVGFVFSNKSDNQTPTIENVGKNAHKSFTTVYSRMLEGEGSRKTENIYAEDGCNSSHAFAFEIMKTPAQITVYARAYVELNNETIVYGEPLAVTATVMEDEKYYNKDFSSLVKDGELHIEDCGAVPNSAYDYGDLLRSAIHTCLETDATLVMQEGTYYCSPEENSEFLVDLSSETSQASGFTLVGNGAKIVNLDAFSGLFRFSESEDISISGLDYDYALLPWVQGEVTAFDSETNEITLKTDKSQTIFDDSRYSEQLTDVFGVIRGSDDVRKIAYNKVHYFPIASVRKVVDKCYVVKINNEMTLNVGDKVTINNRRNSKFSVFDIRTCGGVNLENINVYASAGCIVLGQYMTGDVVLNNVNVLFGNNTDRWTTSNADGVLIQASAGKLVMDNCTFEGLSDDCVNLYQRATVIPEKESNQVFVLDGTATGTRVVQNVGDTLIFYNPDAGETLGEATVTSIEEVEGKSSKYTAKVTIDQEIEGIITSSNLASGTHVYIKEQGHNNSTITNCTFRYARSGGVNIRANNVTVQGNTFEHIANRAVNVAIWSSEGSAVDGIQILNNIVTDCGYHNGVARYYNSGAIGVYMLNYARIAQVPNAIHKDVVVKGNTINGWYARAMWIANSKNVEIANNVFNGDDKVVVADNYECKETIYINECENVTVSGNEFHDNVSNYTGSIIYSEDTVNEIVILDNEFDIEEDRQIVIRE